ncbi:MAG: transporter substrate-binding domain-containing protein [Desulfobacter sp.]|nr:MAG: transporter substrate-binding domain-containing protein [Desulfobacter sp.]
MKEGIIVLLLIFCCSIPASADHFNFVSLEFPPLEYAGRNGEAEGIAVDIVKTIMAHLGHTVDIRIYPWARSLRMVKRGEADAIFTAYKNDEREQFLDYSKTVLIPQIIAFYVRKDSGIKYDGDLLKLKSQRIGVLNTISYGKKFDDVREQLNTRVVQNLKCNFKKLKANRVDLVISNVYMGDSTIKKMGLDHEFKRLSPAVQAVDSFIAFSKARGLMAIRDQFDAALEKLIADGTYDKIMAGYGIKK